MDEIKNLYMGLYSTGSYTKSLEDFRTQMADPEYMKKLYGGLYKQGRYTNSFEEFNNKYQTKKDPTKTPQKTDSTKSYEQGDTSKMYYRKGVGWIGKENIIEEYNNVPQQLFIADETGEQKLEDWAIEQGYKTPNIQRSAISESQKTKVDVIDKEAWKPMPHSRSEYSLDEQTGNWKFDYKDTSKNPFKSKQATNKFIDYINWREGNEVISPNVMYLPFGMGWKKIVDYLGENTKDWLHDYSYGSYHKDGKQVSTGNQFHVFGDDEPTLYSFVDEESEEYKLLQKEEEKRQNIYLKEGITYDETHLDGNPFKNDEATNSFINYINQRKGKVIVPPGANWSSVKSYLGEELNKWIDDYENGYYVDKNNEKVKTGDEVIDKNLLHSKDITKYENAQKEHKVKGIIDEDEEAEILGGNVDLLKQPLDQDHLGKDYLGTKRDVEVLDTVKGKSKTVNIDGTELVIHNRDQSSSTYGESGQYDIEMGGIRRIVVGKQDGKLVYQYRMLESHPDYEEADFALSGTGEQTNWRGSDYKYKIIGKVVGNNMKDIDTSGTSLYSGPSKEEALKYLEGFNDSAANKGAFVSNWDDYIIYEISRGIDPDNQKLLKRDPLRFLFDEKYRAQEISDEEKVLDLEGVTVIDPNKVVSKKGESFYDDPFVFFDPSIYQDNRKYQQLYENTNDGLGKYYYVDLNNDGVKDEKQYLKWDENTPDNIIDEHYKLKKEIEEINKQRKRDEQVYSFSHDKDRGTSYFVRNEFNDRNEFTRWFHDRYEVDGGKFKLKDIYKQSKSGDFKLPGEFEIYNPKYVGRDDWDKSFGVRDTNYIHKLFMQSGEWKKMKKAHKLKTAETDERYKELQAKAKKFLDEKWDKWHQDNYAPDIIEYEKDNDINWAYDFNIKVKEVQADAQQFYTEKSQPIYDEISEGVKVEFEGRFIRNENNEIVDNESGKVVTEEWITKELIKEVKDRSSKHPDIIKLKAQNDALFRNTLTEYQENWKPKRELIPKNLYDEIDSHFSKKNFKNHRPSVQKNLISNAWVKMEKHLRTNYIGDNDDWKDYIGQRKHEFFNYFYDPSGYARAYDKEGQWSAYAINEWAKSVERDIDDIEFAAEGKAKDYGVDYVMYSDQHNYTVESVKKLVRDSNLKASDVDSFSEGFSSLDAVDYIPFIAGFSEIDNNLFTQRIGEKMEKVGWEGLTQEEKTYLTILQLQGVTDQRVREMSSYSYGAGKLSAAMMPYVGEFIMTSGVFSGARTAAKTALTRVLLPKAVYSTGKLVATRQAINFASFMTGTLAQTTVNPQHYINNTIKNMTPEMQMMMGEEGEGVIMEISKHGDSMPLAFAKGFSVHWAEMTTERLGEAIPMFGKYLKGKLPEGGQRWMENMLVSRWMTKMGYTRAEAIHHFAKNKMGWNGLIGEIFEEVVNQPIQNLIMGDDIFEGMDERFFAELTGSMGVTQFVFGGISLATMNRNGPRVYMIQNKRYATREEFYKEIDKLENEGKLNNPDYKIDIRIDNDYVAGDNVKKILSKYEDKGNTLTEKESNNKDDLTASEAETLAALNQEDRDNLEALENESELLQNEKASLKQDRKPWWKTRLKKINQQLKEFEETKINITDLAREQIGLNKRENALKKEVSKVRGLKKKLGWDHVSLQEAETSEEAAEKMEKDQLRQINELELQLKETKNKATQNKIQNEIKGIKSKMNQSSWNEARESHGYISPDGRTIVINKEHSLSKEGGNINVAAHEFLHKGLRATLQQNPATQLAVGSALHGYLMGVDPRQVQNSNFRNRLLAYHSNYGEYQKLNEKYQRLVEQGKTKEAQALASKFNEKLAKEETQFTAGQAEEVLTLFSDALYHGDIKFNENTMSKIGDVFRRVLRSMGVRARFKTGRDVYNFIRDYNRSVAKEKLSLGMKRTLEKGARIKGKISADIAGWQGAIDAYHANNEEGIQASKEAGFDFVGLVDDTFQASKDQPIKDLMLAANTEEIVAKNKDLRNQILELDKDGTAERDAKGKIIVPPLIREELVENNMARVTALASQAERGGAKIELEEGKKKKFGDFFGEYYLKLADLTRTYNAEMVPFGAYMNTYLPLKYSGILTGLKKGEVEGAISLEEKEVAEVEAEEGFIEKAGKTIKLYQKLGKEGLLITQGIQEMMEAGDQKLFGVTNRNFKNLTDLTPSLTQRMFGIEPKPGNLTKGDILNAQMFINKHVDSLISMLPEGHTTAKTATGVQNVLLKEFYNKKSTRDVNLKVQIKKPNINPTDFKRVFGITERGGKNLYKKESNTSARIKALVAQTGKMLTNQAIREYSLKIGNPTDAMRTLQDGTSHTMFSKSVNKLDIVDRVVIQESSTDLANAYDAHGNSMEKAFNIVFNKDLLNLKFENIRANQKGIVKDLERFVENYSEDKRYYEKAGREFMSLDAYIKEETMMQDVDNNLREVLGLDKNSLDSKNKDQLKSVRKAIVKIAEVIGWEKTDRFLKHALSASGRIGGTSLKQGKHDLEYDPTYWINLIDKKVKEIDVWEKNNPGQSAIKKRKELDKLILLQSGFEEPSIRGGYFAGVGDFMSVVLTGLKGYKKGSKNKIKNDTSQNVYVDVSTKKKALENQESAKANENFLIELMSISKKLIAQGEMTKNDLGMVMKALLGDTRSPLAAAARVAYTSEGKKTTTEHIYEHVKPRKRMALKLAGYAAGRTTLKEMRQEFKDFVVAIIPRVEDTKVNNIGLKESMPSWWRSGINNVLERYFNKRTFGRINLSLTDTLTQESVTEFENYNKAYDIAGENHKESLIINKATQFSRKVNPTKGMSVWDFDDTLAKTKSKVSWEAPDGTTGKLNAEDYASSYTDLAKQGYKFDFSEFNLVLEGEIGPFFKKFVDRIKKFGVEDNFILTARPAEAAPAIQEFLKSQGLDIPIENITGLANSTAEAKALWITEKVGEGYNDIYFADDALANIQVVKNVLDQFDVKSKVQQAKYRFSKNMKTNFTDIIEGTGLDLNKILEQTTGIEAGKRFSEAQAKIRGARKGRWKFWVPPSAEDFKGLLYSFLGKGKVGDAHIAFFDKALLKPYARAYSEINVARQVLSNEYRALLKAFPKVKKALKQKIEGTNYTVAHAIRVFLWNQNGMEVPGISKRDLKMLTSLVENNVDYRSFAGTLGLISKQEEGYVYPSEYWTVEDVQSDLNKITAEINREDSLAEWKQNIEKIFGTWQNDRLVGENMNKIEAIYGSKFREALEDIIYRMEFGSSREAGKSRIVNAFNNWANQSVGAIMFFNMRSALLQTISSVNFINWSDNNPLKAGLAFANQPQFWKDFAMIFNSDMLKQRRAGQQRGINEAELAEAVSGSSNKAKAALSWLLTKGFLPTQIADSFAIASGGATFYRNRFNSYIKQGLTEEQAQEMAWADFQENSEESQQSARPDLISQQQASPLGRYILAFKNTPMQYARLVKKAFRDLKNGRGDVKTNISKIVYYMAVQNFIFSAMQTALFATIGSDDEEDKTKRYSRTAHSMFDSIFGGLGIGGNVVVALKNSVFEFVKQEEKEWGADHTQTIIRLMSFSPTIGSKIRKIYGAIQEWTYNEDVIGERGFKLDNPLWSLIGNLVSGITNVPLDRLVKKSTNVDAAINADIDWWQRLALTFGWNTWDLGIKDQDIVKLKEDIKKRKKKQKESKKKEEKKKSDKKKEEKIVEEEIKTEKIEKELIEEDKQTKKKTYYCPNIRDGVRCKMVVDKAGEYCTYHEKVPQRKDGKKTRCTATKSNKEQCKNMTTNKSGLCYSHD